MKYLIPIFLIALFVSCNDAATEEIIQLNYDDASFLVEVDIVSYRDIYIIDSELWGILGNRDNIEIINFTTNERRVWGSTGYGPGEFIRIGDISYSENRIFIYDSVKKSIEIFDRDLNFINTLILESNLISIVAENDSSFYAIGFGMSQLSVLRYRGINFSIVDYIFVESTRNPEDGVSLISRSKNFILLSRLMTNKLTIIDTQSNNRVTATNDYIPSQPNYSYVGEYRVPTKVIWDWGLISGSSVYQLIRERQSSTIYRFGLDGKMNKIFSLDFQAMRMIDYNDSYLFVTPNSLITYPKSIF